MIFKIDDKRYLDFNVDTEEVVVYRIDELKVEQTALTAMPLKPATTDKELLEWAKTSYPTSPDKMLADKTEERKKEVETLITQLEEVK